MDYRRLKTPNKRKSKKHTRVREMTIDYGFVAEGLTHVIGIDEAGWGAIAGPLSVGGVICKISDELEYLDVKDSKKYTTERARDVAYSNIMRFQSTKQITSFCWLVEPDEVAQDPGLALNKAQRIVIDTLLFECLDGKAAVIVDGKKGIPGIQVPQVAVPAADAKFKVVSAASLVAKVERDQYMNNYLDPVYPAYEFYKNKGYPTQKHLAMLKATGPTSAHRFNIALVSDAFDRHGLYSAQVRDSNAE